MVQIVGEAEEREVVHDDRPAFNDKDFLVVNAVKSLNQSSVPENSLGVVVSENEVDMTVKPSRFQAPVPLLNVAETEISEMIHMVFRLNNGIPVVDKSLIHLFNRPESPVAILKDILVEKMS